MQKFPLDSRAVSQAIYLIVVARMSTPGFDNCQSKQTEPTGVNRKTSPPPPKKKKKNRKTKKLRGEEGGSQMVETKDKAEGQYKHGGFLRSL